MTHYATVNDVQSRMLRRMSNEELELCEKLLDDAAVIIDVFAHVSNKNG